MSYSRKDYVAMSSALSAAKVVSLPNATTPLQAAQFQHRAAVEAVAGVLAEAPGFDVGRFLADSSVRPAVRLLPLADSAGPLDFGDGTVISIHDDARGSR